MRVTFPVCCAQADEQGTKGKQQRKQSAKSKAHKPEVPSILPRTGASRRPKVRLKTERRTELKGRSKAQRAQAWLISDFGIESAFAVRHSLFAICYLPSVKSDL
jgi:hypothetical protein